MVQPECKPVNRLSVGQDVQSPPEDAQRKGETTGWSRSLVAKTPAGTLTAHRGTPPGFKSRLRLPASAHPEKQHGLLPPMWKTSTELPVPATAGLWGVTQQKGFYSVSAKQMKREGGKERGKELLNRQPSLHARFQENGAIGKQLVSIRMLGYFSSHRYNFLLQ